MSESRGMQYLVLTDRAAAYFLARVRWPDVSQAVSVGSADWLDDPGLFDLPYNPDSVRVSFPQAVSVAAAFGVQLRAEPARGVPSFMRRMPSNWSDLSPAERRAFGLESGPRRRPPARRLRHLQSAQARAMAAVRVRAGRPGRRRGPERAVRQWPGRPAAGPLQERDAGPATPPAAGRQRASAHPVGDRHHDRRP